MMSELEIAREVMTLVAQQLEYYHESNLSNKDKRIVGLLARLGYLENTEIDDCVIGAALNPYGEYNEN